MGKFAEEESECYRRAEQLRVKILRPWEKQVTEASELLEKQIQEREDEHELSVVDFEIPFNKIGHGLLAVETFKNVETAADILNGCEWLSTEVWVLGQR